MLVVASIRKIPKLLIFSAPREGHGSLRWRSAPQLPQRHSWSQKWPPNHTHPHFNHQTRCVNYKWGCTTCYEPIVIRDTTQRAQERGVGGSRVFLIEPSRARSSLIKPNNLISAVFVAITWAFGRVIARTIARSNGYPVSVNLSYQAWHNSTERLFYSNKHRINFH